MITPFNDITKTEINTEEYQLLLKDAVIANFSISNHNILDCIIVEDKENLLPYYLKQANTAVGLNNFLVNRHIDFTRSNARILLKKLGLRSTKSIMNVIDNYSLSLIDSYWTKPTNQCITYREVNLYDKIHKDFIVDTSLRGIETEINKFEPNPELTNIGSFNKSWIFKDKEWRLYKKGTAYNYYVELLFYKLSTLLNIPCALYQYDKDLQMLYSVNITNKSYQLEHWDSIHNFQTNLDSNILDSLSNMNALDAITYNYDRHEFNYGVIRSTDTGEIIEQAKLFDHNLCLGVGGDGSNNGPLGLGMLKMDISNTTNITYRKMAKIIEAQIINLDNQVKSKIQQENLDTTRQVKHLMNVINHLKLKG